MVGISRKDYLKKWREEHKEHYRSYKRNWDKVNADHVKAYRARCNYNEKLRTNPPKASQTEIKSLAWKAKEANIKIRDFRQLEKKITFFNCDNFQLKKALTFGGVIKKEGSLKNGIRMMNVYSPGPHFYQFMEYFCSIPGTKRGMR